MASPPFATMMDPLPPTDPSRAKLLKEAKGLIEGARSRFLAGVDAFLTALPSPTTHRAWAYFVSHYGEARALGVELRFRERMAHACDSPALLPWGVKDIRRYRR